MKALGIDKTKEVFLAIKPAMNNTRWRVRSEAIKMFVELSVHFKKLDYFKTYWEALFLQSFADPVTVIRTYCMEQLPVYFLNFFMFMMYRD